MSFGSTFALSGAVCSVHQISQYTARAYGPVDALSRETAMGPPRQAVSKHCILPSASQGYVNLTLR